MATRTGGNNPDDNLYAIKEITKEGYEIYYSMNGNQLNEGLEKARRSIITQGAEIEKIKKMSIWQFIKWRKR